MSTGGLKARRSLKCSEDLFRWLRLNTSCGAALIPLILILALPARLYAQFDFTTNNGALTIRAYTGPDGAVDVPSETNGLTVVNIGKGAFSLLEGLTSITIPDSITNIGDSAFQGCIGLTSAMIPDGVVSIGNFAFANTSITNLMLGTNISRMGKGAFYYCDNLSEINVDQLNPVYSSLDGVLFNKSQTTLIQFPQAKANAYTIPNSVTSIGNSAFYDCTSLTNVVVSGGVTNIGDSVFWNCYSLLGIYFQGNCPSYGINVFYQPSGRWGYPATAYYLPGTTGWDIEFDGVPTALWTPVVQTSDSSFGVRTNLFGFNINWASGMVVVVEASTDLAFWWPLQTNTFPDSSIYFSDPQWKNYPARFYRIRSH